MWRTSKKKEKLEKKERNWKINKGEKKNWRKKVRKKKREMVKEKGWIKFEERMNKLWKKGIAEK